MNGIPEKLCKYCNALGCSYIQHNPQTQTFYCPVFNLEEVRTNERVVLREPTTATSITTGETV